MEQSIEHRRACERVRELVGTAKVFRSHELANTMQIVFGWAELIEIDPDETSYGPYLVRSLNVMAGTLQSLGAEDLASEVLSIADQFS